MAAADTEVFSGGEPARLCRVHEVIVVCCPCERSVEFPPGFLQRRYRVPSDTLVFDLQFRLRCKGCNRGSGFRITIFDNRMRGDNSKPRLERVVAINRSDSWDDVATKKPRSETRSIEVFCA